MAVSFFISEHLPFILWLIIIFQRGFFLVFVCFRKAVRKKIASHCARQSRIMEVLMITQQQRWGGVERPKLTNSSEDICKDKKVPPIPSTPWPYLSMGPSKPSVWALKRLEPTGLVGNAKQVVGDWAVSPLLALPFDFLETLSWGANELANSGHYTSGIRGKYLRLYIQILLLNPLPLPRPLH